MAPGFCVGYLLGGGGGGGESDEPWKDAYRCGEYDFIKGLPHTNGIIQHNSYVDGPTIFISDFGTEGCMVNVNGVTDDAWRRCKGWTHNNGGEAPFGFFGYFYKDNKWDGGFIDWMRPHSDRRYFDVKQKIVKLREEIPDADKWKFTICNHGKSKADIHCRTNFSDGNGKSDSRN